MAGLSENLDHPYDATAERALLGSTLMAPEQCRETFLSVRPDDWYIPASQRLAAIIAEMMRAGRPIDPNSVVIEAQNRGLVPAKINPAEVLSLVQMAWLPESAPLLAQRIKDLSAARKLAMVGTRLAQRMEQYRWRPFLVTSTTTFVHGSPGSAPASQRASRCIPRVVRCNAVPTLMTARSTWGRASLSSR